MKKFLWQFIAPRVNPGSSEFRRTVPIPMVWILATLLTGCVAPGTSQEPSPEMPTDAEVEQYNASVEPEDRIVCRNEINVGSNIPKRRCRLVRDMEETSIFHREQLRRALR